MHHFPKMRRACALLFLGCLPACLGGLGPSDEPLTMHYYSAAVSSKAEPKATGSMPLRMRRVTSASLLGKRIVWRSSMVKYGFYEANRWTEQPKDWLEEALAKELFETRGIMRTESVQSPTLAVHLAAFEEIRQPAHEARVALVLRLIEPNGESLSERSLEAREPIQDDEMNTVATAMSKALERVVHEVAGITIGAMGKPAP